jgi:hypothetical protein
MLSRDPVSELFDPAARRLLTRAYDARGQWTGVFVAPPTPRQRAWAAAELGIYDLSERDRWGEVRWVRGLKRSVYWNLRYYGRPTRIDFSEQRAGAGARTPFAAALEWQTGARVLKAGWPSRRWAVRIRIRPGGHAAVRAVEQGPARQRWVGSSLQSTQADRDW